MRSRRIGDVQVGSVGLGMAGLSVADPPGEADAVRVILAALDAGMTLLDTATCYVPSHLQQGHGERLIAKALRQWPGDPDGVLAASKAGLERVDTIAFERDFRGDGSPAAIRRCCEQSLRSLGVERIGLYQLHAPDSKVPLQETLGEFRRLREEGKIAQVGLCNVDLEQLETARAVVPIASVQNRFNPADRTSLPVLRRCAELGIAFLPYSPLGGLGARARELPARVTALAEIARERGVSPHQVALAWELAQGPQVIPIPGCRRPATVLDSAAAAELVLAPSELERLDALEPVLPVP